MNETVHGTTSTYVNRRCRCDACRAAFTAYQRRRRQRLRGLPLPPWVLHGTTNAYWNYMCRCAHCRQAHNEWFRTWRAARKAAAS